MSLPEAVELLRAILPEPRAQRVPLHDLDRRVLAADTVSLVDHPSLDDSALDGFAVRAADLVSASGERAAALRLVGEVPAGGRFQGRVGPGQAVRIFTGAPVPDGADAILMVEHATVDGDRVLASRPATPDAVRPRGQDLRAGVVHLRAGRTLGPHEIALAAAMGHAALEAFERPRVAILPTGDEIREPGEPLPAGGAYNSNAPGLAAMVRAVGGEPVVLPSVPDDPSALRAALDAVSGVHLLLTSGGVSMGDRDHVRKLLEAEGSVEYWRVRIKPGGPPLCGRWRDLAVLGLPGNPVSALVVFLVVVRPALLERWGALEPPYETVRARALTAFGGAGGKLALHRATLAADRTGWTLSSFANQSSGVLRSLVESNALALVPPNASVAAGETIEAIRL